MSQRFYYNKFSEDIFDDKIQQYLSNQTICNILNQQDEQIIDLEAKLAESEKKFIVANNLRKNSDEVLLNYKTKKYGLDKTIQELRKMKLSLPEKEWYYKGFENCERQMSSHIADLTLEVKQLKQQLGEKDKKIKWLGLFAKNIKIFTIELVNKLKSDLYNNENINIRVCDIDEIDKIFDKQIEEIENKA